MSCDDTRMFSPSNENKSQKLLNLDSAAGYGKEKKRPTCFELFERINGWNLNDFVVISLNLYISEGPSFSSELAL